jgi:hypothetical protein
MATFWVVATFAATLVVWLAIRVVADDVSEPEPAAVAAPPASTPTSDAPSGPDGVSTTTALGATATTRRPDNVGGPTIAPTVPQNAAGSGQVTTSTTATTRATATTSTTTSTSPPPSTTRTFNGQGGSVTIRFLADAVELVLATPANGFTTQVDDDGPDRVRVEFRSNDHTTRIEANAGDTTAQVTENGGGGEGGGSGTG